MSYQDEFDQEIKLEIPAEFQDFLVVLEPGARKHGPNNWLEKTTPRTSFIGFHDAISHHFARSFAAGPDGDRQDPESKLEHLLHLICNAQMLYTKIKRGHYN